MNIDQILEVDESSDLTSISEFRLGCYVHQLAAEVRRLRERERVLVEALSIDLIDYACLYAERLMIDMDAEQDYGRKTVLRQRIDEIFAMAIKARAALEAVKE